jgi:hypothetical protein
MVVTTAQLIVVGAAVFIAAFIQVVAGFGFALLAVPLMTLAIEPKVAVVVSTLTGLFVTSWQAYKDRAIAERPLVKRMTIAAYVGMRLVCLFVTVNDDVLNFCSARSLIAVVLLAMRINPSCRPAPRLRRRIISVPATHCRPVRSSSRCRLGSCRRTGSGDDLDDLRAEQHRRAGAVHRLDQITRDGVVAAAVRFRPCSWTVAGLSDP